MLCDENETLQEHINNHKMFEEDKMIQCTLLLENKNKMIILEEELANMITQKQICDDKITILQNENTLLSESLSRYQNDDIDTLKSNYMNQVQLVSSLRQELSQANDNIKRLIDELNQIKKTLHNEYMQIVNDTQNTTTMEIKRIQIESENEIKRIKEECNNEIIALELKLQNIQSTITYPNEAIDKFKDNDNSENVNIDEKNNNNISQNEIAKCNSDLLVKVNVKYIIFYLLIIFN
jgi:hypothetical protein